MKLLWTTLLLLTACGGEGRFTEENLAADDIPDDPSSWAYEDNKPSMVAIPGGSYLLASTEVTQGLYRSITGRNPSLSVGQSTRMVGETLPVQGLSFLDAVRFCNALSDKEGVAPAYAIEGQAVTWIPESDGYRLPTEQEWTQAALAGTEQPYAGAESAATVCSVANVADKSLGRSDGFSCSDGLAGKAAVGSLQPNAWGLHDMTGNVWEWVWTEPTEAGERVYKGGGWLDGPQDARVEARRSAAPDEMSIQLGLRVARSAQAPEKPTEG